MTNEVSYCPICQARVEPGKPCWLCRSTLSGQATADISRPPRSENPYEPPTPIGDAPGASVVSIVLVIGVIIVLVALTVAAPGLGILLLMVVAPALIRTAVVVARRRRLENRDVSVGEKSVLFMASIAGVFAAAGAAAVAFGVTCAATCFGLIAVAEASGGGAGMDSLFIAAMALSALIGLGIGGFTLHRLWRLKV